MKIPQPYWLAARKKWVVKLDGQQVSLGPDKAAAFAQYYRLMLARAAAGELTVAALAEEYLTWLRPVVAESTYVRRHGVLVRLVKQFGAIPVADMRGHMVAAWVRKTYPTANPTTLNTVLTCVAACFNWGRKMGHYAASPIEGMVKPSPLVRDFFLPPTLWSTVLDACRDQCWRDLLWVTLRTGARAQEIVVVTAAQLDHEHRWWAIERKSAKGKRDVRLILVPDEVWPVVLVHAEQYPDGPVFRNSKGRPWLRSATRLRFKRMEKRLPPGTGRITMTSLRHSLAHAMVLRGEKAEMIATVLGHKDTRMVLRVYGSYLKAQERLRQVVNQPVMKPSQE